MLERMLFSWITEPKLKEAQKRCIHKWSPKNINKAKKHTLTNPHEYTKAHIHTHAHVFCACWKISSLILSIITSIQVHADSSFQYGDQADSHASCAVGWERVRASRFILVPWQLVSAEKANSLVKLKILPDVFVPSQAEWPWPRPTSSYLRLPRWTHLYSESTPTALVLLGFWVLVISPAPPHFSHSVCVHACICVHVGVCAYVGPRRQQRLEDSLCYPSSHTGITCVTFRERVFHWNETHQVG